MCKIKVFHVTLLLWREKIIQNLKKMTLHTTVVSNNTLRSTILAIYEDLSLDEITCYIIQYPNTICCSLNNSLIYIKS